MAPQPIDELNQACLHAEYAVRGAIVARADQLKAELKAGKKLPFSEIIYTNIGNPMQLGMPYAQFTREFQSLIAAPHLLYEEGIEELYDPEAVTRARNFYKEEPGGLGHYSNPKGFLTVRKEVANFINQRDGYASDPEQIYLTNGASSGIKDCIQLLSGPEAYESAFMIPVPQYPLYDATIKMNCCAAIPYYVNEEAGWSINIEDIEAAYKKHMAESPEIKIRGLIVINPNNPCGSVLDKQKIVNIIKFCKEKNIVLFADEVYETNLYFNAETNSKPEFFSFKKLMMEYEKQTGEKGPMLLSFHSVSKGITGECGQRGGYLEMWNNPQYFADELYKLMSISLCSNVMGQLVVSVMVNPPNSEVFRKHCQDLLAEMERKAQAVYQRLNSAEHMSCKPIEGSMYAFPNIELPKRFLVQCFGNGQAPDAVYCMKLLEATGIVTVSGSGFLQKEGTFHYRTSILEKEEKISSILDALIKFHQDFWRQWG